MNGPDVEGVLGRHLWVDRPNELCACGLPQPTYGVNRMEVHLSHVAAAVRAEVRAWLESEAENVARVIAAIDGDPWDSLGDRGQDANRRAALAALAALAEQVGRVASSRVPGEES